MLGRRDAKRAARNRWRSNSVFGKWSFAGTENKLLQTGVCPCFLLQAPSFERIDRAMTEPREGARAGLSACGASASMTQGVTVRVATISDLPALMHLETLFPEGDRISARSWRRFLTRHDCVFVAEQGMVLGAVVVLTRAGSLTARIYSLAVDERAQGRGVGRVLIEAAHRRAAEAYCTRLSLEVRPDNDPARRLYRRCGFVERGVKPEHYADGTSALIMDRAVLQGPAETLEQ